MPDADDLFVIEKLIEGLSAVVDSIDLSVLANPVTPMQKALADAQDELGALISKLENAKVGNVPHRGSQG